MPERLCGTGDWGALSPREETARIATIAVDDPAMTQAERIALGKRQMRALLR